MYIHTYINSCKADLRSILLYYAKRWTYKVTTYKENKNREEIEIYLLRSLGQHHTQGGEDENFSALTLSLLVVMCFHGAAKLTAALPPEQNDIVCTLSLSLPHSSSSCTRLLPLLFFARLLAA